MRQTDLARAHPKTERFDKTEQPPLATPVGDFIAYCDVAREHGNLVNPTQLRHRRTVVAVEHIRLALLPGSMDLVAFVWLASANSQVRKEAATSGVIGIIRVALPLLAVGYYAARSGVQECNPACAVSSFLLIPLALLIIGLWAFTALISAFVLWRVTRATAA